MSALHRRDQGRLNSLSDPAVERFRGLPEEEQDDLKNAIQSFTRLYSFLSQIMPFHDLDLEKLFAYLRFLQKKLPRRNLSEQFQLEDEVALEYYRLQKMEEGQIVLEKSSEGALSGAKEAGVRYQKDEEKAPISQIIEVLNDRLGTDFTPSDQLFFDQIEEDMVTDEVLLQQAQSKDRKSVVEGRGVGAGRRGT